MSMYTEVNNIALGLGIAQSLFLASILLRRHRKLYANRFLAALMLVYGAVLGQLLVQDLGVFASHPWFYFVLSGLPLTAAPLHYLYARHLIHPEKRMARSEWLHVLPFVVYKLTELPLLRGSSADVATLLAQSDTLDIPARFFLFNWAIIVQSMAYMVVTLLLLRRHATGLEHLASSLDHLRLRWLRNITLLTLGAWLLFCVEYGFYLGGMTLGPRFGFTGILGGVLVYVLGYLGLSRSEVLEASAVHESMSEVSLYREQESAGDAVMDTAVSAEARYAKSGLGEDRAAEAAERLRELMEDRHLYTDSGLTLPQLAKLLDLTPHNLSEVINTRFGQNFFDFVNAYRLRRVQADLRDPSKANLTILAIAFDAGFNSKTSFNTIFKKHTGTTPSAWRAR